MLSDIEIITIDTGVPNGVWRIPLSNFELDALASTFFAALFRSSKPNQKDGSYFIHGFPAAMRYIMPFLRDPSAPILSENDMELRQHVFEASVFFQMPPLFAANFLDLNADEDALPVLSSVGLVKFVVDQCPETGRQLWGVVFRHILLKIHQLELTFSSRDDTAVVATSTATAAAAAFELASTSAEPHTHVNPKSCYEDGDNEMCRCFLTKVPFVFDKVSINGEESRGSTQRSFNLGHQYCDVVSKSHFKPSHINRVKRIFPLLPDNNEDQTFVWAPSTKVQISKLFASVILLK